MTPLSCDVLIAGAGVAGIAAANAMSRQGLRVVVADRAGAAARPFSGEVLHPAALTGLEALGMSTDALLQVGVSLQGFRLLPHAADGDAVALRYPVGAGKGLAVSHAWLAEALQVALRRVPTIHVLNGARLQSLSDGGAAGVDAVLRLSTGDSRLRCRMLIGADGLLSQTARFAGLQISMRRLSTMAICTVPLEAPEVCGWGCIHLTSGAPILVYPVSANEARVLFEVERASGMARTAAAALSQHLPPPLQGPAAQAARQALLMPVQETIPERAGVGSVVLVGDAGGRCHPLTASGITASLRDAAMLEYAVTRHWPDVARVREAYLQQRTMVQRTRYLLANALRETLHGQSPTFLLDGLLAYWRSSERAGVTSMALLSGARSDAGALAYETAKVLWHGVVAGWRRRHCLTVVSDAVASARRLFEHACESGRVS